MKPANANPCAGLEKHLHFQTLLARLSSQFINLAPERIDAHINDALGAVAEFLGFELAAVSKFTGRSSEGEVTHIWTAPGLPPIPPGFTQHEFPWKAKLLTLGNDARAPTLDVLPPEAAVDRATYEGLGVRSVYDWCLRPGGDVIGCFSLLAIGEPRPFPEEFEEGLNLFAQVLANALARERAVRELRESEARLSLAADSAQAGLWSLEANSGRLWMTPQNRLQFAIPPDEAITFESLLTRIHPEDRESLRQIVEHVLRTGGEGNIEYRIVLPDGSVRWVVSRGRAQGCGDGGRCLMGITWDVTERKQGEARLRASEARLAAAVDVAKLGFYELGAEPESLFVDERLRGLLGLSKEAAHRVHAFWIEHLHPEDRARITELSRKVFSGELGSVAVEYRYQHPTRGTLWFSHVSRVEEPNEDGKVMRRFGVIRDITERKSSEAALQQSLLEIHRLKDRLQAESDYLKAEIKVTQSHGEVIGKSAGIQQVLAQVEQVAPTDSSVLIRGETGTGKERIAQAIHRSSPRRSRVMITVNCAALPSALVESELFGREKGAFTGALTRQVGRFELADESTVFLDEVGELSLEVQAKLLRVLQEGQFERLGSPKTLRVNVRVIAATNRDLDAEVRCGRFREDLYYRLNVFPIRVPPLRERIEDIPLLVWAFLEEFSTRMGRRITQVPRKTMEMLQGHSWPGNVRELRNVIENGVIVTAGDTLRVPLLEDRMPATAPAAQTLADSEREHILRILKETSWRIKGPKGAAALLDLNASTLYSRMEKLGIPTRRNRQA